MRHYPEDSFVKDQTPASAPKEALSKRSKLSVDGAPIAFVICCHGLINGLYTLRAILMGRGPKIEHIPAELTVFISACLLGYGTYHLILAAGRRYGVGGLVLAAILSTPPSALIFGAIIVLSFGSLTDLTPSWRGIFDSLYVQMSVMSSLAMSVAIVAFIIHRDLQSLRREYGGAASETPPPAFIWCTDGRRKVRIDLTQVILVTAEGDYVRIHTPLRQHLVRGPLKTFGAALPADQFMRVQRSAIVRLDMIENLERRGSIWWITLQNGVETSISRQISREVRSRIARLGGRDGPDTDDRDS
ncbi:LytR/AlgR family response regulator transcription factor [Caulobacter sp. NIBR2454]|uniref:LytR/AlgR family response regulator transcription factor n=1 Tax=Caulobacter sp. NIBR2454 TaxID=3015996 RepID=UPI0022B61476|nr:LytTR family DNA-binding domain-containing protein [Caulobacter sp. NIBR2454]